MQDLGSEVGELSGFVEADDLDAAGVGTEARVGGHHAIDVGPDFDALGVEAGAENGGGEIGAAAADGGRDAGAIGADESAHHRNVAGFDQGRDFLLQALVGFLELRNGAHEGAVGEQALARIDVDSGQSAGNEGGGDDLAGENFAERGDVIVGAGSDFADRADAAQELVEVLEVGAEIAVEFGEERGAEEFSGGIVVAFAEGARHFQSGLAIAAAGGFAHGEQGIGDLGHRADDHDRTIGQAALDDLGDAVDGFGVLHGGPAELHDDHGRGSCGLARFPGDTEDTVTSCQFRLP
jgi:hypothetical protein